MFCTIGAPLGMLIESDALTTTAQANASSNSRVAVELWKVEVKTYQNTISRALPGIRAARQWLRSTRDARLPISVL